MCCYSTMRDRNAGHVCRTYKCDLCDRTFRADKRSADKLIKLHYEKTHNTPFVKDGVISMHIATIYQKDHDNLNTITKLKSGHAHFDEIYRSCNGIL